MGSEATAFLLRQADMLVKEKQYEAAMKLVRAVRAQDPQNPYAIAYEERIRVLVLNGPDRRMRPAKPALSTDAERADVTGNEEAQQDPPEDSESDRYLRIRNYIRFARTFLAAGREEEALNELAFASMIDPHSEEVQSFEEEIKRIRAERNPEQVIAETPELVAPEEEPASKIENVVEEEKVEETPEPSDPVRCEEDAVIELPPIEAPAMKVEEKVDSPPVPTEDLTAAPPIILESASEPVEELAARPEFVEEEPVTFSPVIEESFASEAQGLAEEVDAGTTDAVPEPEFEEPDIVDSPVEELRTAEVAIEPPPEVVEPPIVVRPPEDIGRPGPDKMKRQVDRATKLFTSGAFDEALAEVALGLVDDPDNAALRELEQKIWQAKDASSDEQGDTRYQRNHLVRLHLLAAEEFRKKNEFTRALDEVAKAYALDPENKDIKQTDARIREGESRQSRNDGKILKLVYPNTKTAGGSA